MCRKISRWQNSGQLLIQDLKKKKTVCSGPAFPGAHWKSKVEKNSCRLEVVDTRPYAQPDKYLHSGQGIPNECECPWQWQEARSEGKRWPATLNASAVCVCMRVVTTIPVCPRQEVWPATWAASVKRCLGRRKSTCTHRPQGRNKLLWSQGDWKTPSQ